MLALLAFVPVIILAVLFALAARGEGKDTSVSLKKAYLYLVSVISLVICVIGGITLLNMGLKTYVFTKADRDYYGGPCIAKYNPDGSQSPCSAEETARQEEQSNNARSAQKQRDAAQALSMIIVAAPVWWFHWRLAKREA